MLSSDNALNLWIEADDLIRQTELACSFPQNVSVDADVRQASLETSKQLSEFNIETMSRAELYQALQTTPVTKLGFETMRYLEKTLYNFRKNGLGFNQEKRALLLEKQNQLSILIADSLEALNSDDSKMYLTLDQLKGMTDDFIKELVRNSLDGEEPQTFEIKAIYSHIYPILEQCTVESTRKAAERLLENRASSNAPRLGQISRLRHEIAQLLNYDNYAQYALESRMAKNPQTVQAMHDNLISQIQLKADDERAHLVALAGHGVPLQSHNIRFLQNLRLQSFQVDKELISHYFPLEHILAATLELYQELFDLKFTKLIGTPTWHPTVEHYDVHGTDGQHWGEFYLDLYPRENKYKHEAVFQLQNGLLSGRIAKAAMVCNFSHPPCLLKHSEFVTLLHEFGHVIHNLLGHTLLAASSGTNVEKDFVEMPSTMMENYCWERRVLQRVTKHHLTGKPMPDTLIDDLIKSRHVNSGLFYLRLAFYGIADQVIHQCPHDPQTIFTELRPKILGCECPMDTHSLANVWHYFGGYEACFYGYLWSDIYAADIFQALGDCLNPENVRRYSRTILQRGGSCDAELMLLDFLHREPNTNAFIQRLE